MTKKRVKKFVLDDESDREEYEGLLNDENVKIIRDEFMYDKSRNNQALVTVWWEEKDPWSIAE